MRIEPRSSTAYPELVSCYCAADCDGLSAGSSTVTAFGVKHIQRVVWVLNAHGFRCLGYRPVITHLTSPWQSAVTGTCWPVITHLTSPLQSAMTGTCRPVITHWTSPLPSAMTGRCRPVITHWTSPLPSAVTGRYWPVITEHHRYHQPWQADVSLSSPTEHHHYHLPWQAYVGLSSPPGFFLVSPCL
jgi:hypothetical protein